MEEPIFLCNSDPHHLVASLFGAVANSDSRSKSKMKNLFPDIDTTINIKLSNILEKLNQRRNRPEHARFGTSQNDCDNEIGALTQILQIQKKSITRFSRISGTLLQCCTRLWFQQCKIRSKFNQILFATHSCYWGRHWTHFHQENEPIHLVQVWW